MHLAQVDRVSPLSFIMSNVFHMLKPIWLRIYNNWDWHLFRAGTFYYLFHTGSLSLYICFIGNTRNDRNSICTIICYFCHLTGNIVITSNYQEQPQKSYMHNHFCYSHLTEDIITSSNCHAQIYKSYMHGHIFAYCVTWQEIMIWVPCASLLISHVYKWASCKHLSSRTMKSHNVITVRPAT